MIFFPLTQENTGVDNPDLFEGDVILNADQRMAIEMGLNIDNPFGRGAQKGKEWPKGVMIFAVDPALCKFIGGITLAIY